LYFEGNAAVLEFSYYSYICLPWIEFFYEEKTIYFPTSLLTFTPSPLCPPLIETGFQNIYFRKN
jgi:hypothetical protein